MFPITITLQDHAQLVAVMAALHADKPVNANRDPEPAKEKPAAKKEVKKDEPAKAEAAPIPATVEPTAAPEPKVEASAPVVDFETVKKDFLALAGKNRAGAVEILGKFGAAKLTEVKPEDFAECHAAIKGAL